MAFGDIILKNDYKLYITAQYNTIISATYITYVNMYNFTTRFPNPPCV